MGTNKAKREEVTASSSSIFDQIVKGGRSSRHDTEPKLTACPPFLYFYSPSEVEVVEGEVWPQPQRIRLEPGVYVNNKGNIDQVLLYQSKSGRTLIEEMPVTAFGETHQGYIKRIQVGKNSDGEPVYHYHDVWTRYHRIGAVTKKEYDYQGFHLFRKQILELMGGSIDPAISKPLLASLQRDLDRARQIAAHYASQAIAVNELEGILAKPETKVKAKD